MEGLDTFRAGAGSRGASAAGRASPRSASARTEVFGGDAVGAVVVTGRRPTLVIDMAYITAEARQQMLDDLAGAIEALGDALAALGAAYELLDDQTADRVEEQLFRPVQSAFGRAQRTHAGFAERYGLPVRTFGQGKAGPVSQGARALLDRAVDAVDEADHALVELQDSMMPVEVGDPQLRAGLAEVRALVEDIRARARTVLRTLGR
jgi:hypothetical protein